MTSARAAVVAIGPHLSRLSSGGQACISVGGSTDPVGVKSLPRNTGFVHRTKQAGFHLPWDLQKWLMQATSTFSTLEGILKSSPEACTPQFGRIS